jgi:hypothetical protein
MIGQAEVSDLICLAAEFNKDASRKEQAACRT